MIFVGSDFKKSKFIFGIGFSKSKNGPFVGKSITNYYLILHFGHRRYWLGYNRLKRIIRDKLYYLDGKKVEYD